MRKASARDEAHLAGLPVVRAVDAAEARGDAGAALDLIERDMRVRGDLRFWRPWRCERLVLIETLGPLLPAWTVSRWLLAQATQGLQPSMAGRVRRALDVAIAARGGRATLEGVDDLDARCRVMDHDWVFRQVLLYEVGAADHFVRRIAAPELVRRADRIDEWLRTPMGGYRLVCESPRLLTWVDLATGKELQSLNIGSATLVEPGECVIGRLVPIEQGRLFDTAPLCVPADLARRVADEPADWVAAVSEVSELDRETTEVGLVTDVPVPVQTLVATRCSGSHDSEEEVVAHRSVHRRVALVRAAIDDRLVEGDLEVAPYPSIAAALCEPLVLMDLVADLGPADVPGLLSLAELLAGPADLICRSLAHSVEIAA